MKRLFFATTAILLVSCAVYKAQLPGHINSEKGVYVNEDAGFMLTLPPEWDIGTDPKTAPPSFRRTFKSLQSNSTEALFLGSNKSQRAYVRCIAEAYDSSLESYFKLLVEASKNEQTPLRSDYFKGAGRELIIWSYKVKSENMDIRMIEYVFDIGSLKCRLSFWTLPGLTDDYKPAFEDVARSICVFDTAGDTAAGCARVWLAKDSAQESRPLEYACDKKELYFPQAADDPCAGPAHSCLWKVTGPKSTCYLFGSIHLAKPEMYPLNPVVEQAFDSSDYLVVEVNVSSKENTQKAATMMQDAVYQDGSQLKDHISPALNKKVETYLAAKGVPVSSISKFKPWFTALFLQIVQMKALGLSPEYGVDRYFLNKAAAKQILELETLEQQMALLKTLNGESFLGYSLMDLTSTESNMLRMIKAWSCGNTAVLDELIFGSLEVEANPEIAGILENFIYARNRAMASKVASFLNEGKKCFVVVGAGHYIGKKSVVDLLQKTGYKVEQQ